MDRIANYFSGDVIMIMGTRFRDEWRDLVRHTLTLDTMHGMVLLSHNSLLVLGD